MRTQELIAGLRRANPNLHAPDPSSFRYIVEGAGTVGLYLGDPGNVRWTDGGATRGKVEMLCTIPVGIIPEWTQIGPKGLVIARGWRSILEKVVRCGAATKAALEREFKVSLAIDGKDVLCAKCRKGGERRRGEGASGLCRMHDNAARAAKRIRETMKGARH